MDRVIQQGIVQVISPMCEPLFSEWSYGFRPNRSCEKAVRQLLEYLNEGYEWIEDIDLEKFFDHVPQGGNLSPLLSNIMLNELDKEVEARGLRFIRYADDCVIAVKSESSTKRDMGTAMTETDAHRRTRLRINIWKQWKVPKKRQWGLEKLGVRKELAR